MQCVYEIISPYFLFYSNLSKNDVLLAVQLQVCIRVGRFPYPGSCKFVSGQL